MASTPHATTLAVAARGRDIGPISHLARMRHPARFLAAAVALTLAGCRNPRTDANMADALMQMSAQLSSIQQDYSILQSQVDSLRLVVAHQDSVVARLASLANLPADQR